MSTPRSGSGGRIWKKTKTTVTYEIYANDDCSSITGSGSGSGSGSSLSVYGPYTLNDCIAIGNTGISFQKYSTMIDPTPLLVTTATTWMTYTTSLCEHPATTTVRAKDGCYETLLREQVYEKVYRKASDDKNLYLKTFYTADCSDTSNVMSKKPMVGDCTQGQQIGPCSRRCQEAFYVTVTFLTAPTEAADTTYDVLLTSLLVAGGGIGVLVATIAVVILLVVVVVVLVVKKKERDAADLAFQEGPAAEMVSVTATDLPFPADTNNPLVKIQRRSSTSAFVLKEWLNTAGMGEFEASLRAEGFDNVSSLRDLEMDDLKEIGVVKLADRKAILKAIALL